MKLDAFGAVPDCLRALDPGKPISTWGDDVVAVLVGLSAMGLLLRPGQEPAMRTRAVVEAMRDTIKEVVDRGPASSYPLAWAMWRRNEGKLRSLDWTLDPNAPKLYPEEDCAP